MGVRSLLAAVVLTVPCGAAHTANSYQVAYAAASISENRACRKIANAHASTQVIFILTTATGRNATR